MSFDWQALERAAAVEESIRKKDYREARRLLREELHRRPDDERLLTQLADLYLFVGKKDRALGVLRHLADRLASSGQAAKAVAILKKIQQIDLESSSAYERVATLIRHDSATDAESFAFADEDDDELDVGLIEEDQRVSAANQRDADVRVVEEHRLVDEGVPTPLFDDFNRDELLAFMRGLQLHVFDPGDIVVAQGDPGDSLFIVTTGIVKAYVRDGQRHRHVRTLHDGDFFGEISVLSGGPRSATVTAATRCELLELDRAALDTITASHPRVRDVLQRFYTERITTS